MQVIVFSYHQRVNIISFALAFTETDCMATAKPKKNKHAMERTREEIDFSKHFYRSDIEITTAATWLVKTLLIIIAVY